jgi:hypothetical protein
MRAWLDQTILSEQDYKEFPGWMTRVFQLKHLALTAMAGECYLFFGESGEGGIL